jgi:hypothetical protein
LEAMFNTAWAKRTEYMLKKHRRTLALLMTLCAVLALAGCRKPSPAETGSPTETGLPTVYPMSSNGADGRPFLRARPPCPPPRSRPPR